MTQAPERGSWVIAASRDPALPGTTTSCRHRRPRRYWLSRRYPYPSQHHPSRVRSCVRTVRHDIRFWDIDKAGCAVDLVEKSLYTADYQRLCAVLVELRHQAGLTQVQVAAALRVPQSFVSKYEAGQRRLDVIELDHIAAVLGTTLTAIVSTLTGNGDAPTNT